MAIGPGGDGAAHESQQRRREVYRADRSELGMRYARACDEHGNEHVVASIESTVAAAMGLAEIRTGRGEDRYVDGERTIEIGEQLDGHVGVVGDPCVRQPLA